MKIIGLMSAFVLVCEASFARTIVSTTEKTAICRALSMVFYDIVPGTTYNNKITSCRQGKFSYKPSTKIHAVQLSVVDQGHAGQLSCELELYYPTANSKSPKAEILDCK